MRSAHTWAGAGTAIWAHTAGRAPLITTATPPNAIHPLPFFCFAIMPHHIGAYEICTTRKKGGSPLPFGKGEHVAGIGIHPNGFKMAANETAGAMVVSPKEKSARKPGGGNPMTWRRAVLMHQQGHGLHCFLRWCWGFDLALGWLLPRGENKCMVYATATQQWPLWLALGGNWLVE